MIFISKF